MTTYRQALLGAAACLALFSVRSAHALAEEDESAEAEGSSTEGEDPDEASEPTESEDTAASNDDSEAEPSPEAQEDERPVVAPPRPRAWARLWLGVTGTIDIVPMPSGSDLCKLTATGVPQNSVGAYCTNPDGSDFPSRKNPAQNNALISGSSGNLDGGLTDGNLRLLFAADYAATSALLVGVRVGYAFNGYSGSAVDSGFPALDKNLHAELRLAYLFGKDPLSEVGFAPMVFVAGGASEFAAHVTRFVSLNTGGDQPVDIWIVRGPWFAALGAGVRYQFSPRVAFTAALRLNTVFGDPSVLFTAGPDLGIAYGF